MGLWWMCRCCRCDLCGHVVAYLGKLKQCFGDASVCLLNFLSVSGFSWFSSRSICDGFDDMSELDKKAPIPQTAAEMQRMRKGRNLALLGIIVGLVVLFYVLTLVKVGGAS